MNRGVVGIAATALLCLADVSSGQPIALPVGDLTVVNYSGYETVHHVNGNISIGLGDVFDGIFQAQSIRNTQGTVDLSPQLSFTELTGAFQFHISAASSSAHLEFAPDFFRLFAGTGASRNFDPAAANAVTRATDGVPWLQILPGGFFESVNDPFNGAPRNQAWLDVTSNFTGYNLAPAPFATLLGRDPTHLYNGMLQGDHFIQAYFEDFPTPSDLPNYSFQIHGQLYLNPVPEPSGIVLMISGLVVVGGYLLRKSRQDNLPPSSMDLMTPLSRYKI
jgi:hypothetical protein